MLDEHTSAAATDMGWLAARWWPHVTVLLLIAMELSWVTPWFRTLIEISYVAAPLVIVLVLGGFMLTGYFFSQAFEGLRLIPTLKHGLLLALYLVFLVLSGQVLLNLPVGQVTRGLLSLRPGAVLVVIVTVWLWWRGISLGHDPVGPLIVWRRFVLGLFMLVAHAFIVTRMGPELINRAPGLWLFTLFVFVSLLAMVFGRVSFVSLSHGVKKNPFDRRWLVSTVTIIGIVVAVSVVLGVMLTGQYRLLLDQTAEGVKYLAMVVLYIVSLPWLLIVYLLVPLFPLLRQVLPSPGSPPAATIEPYPGPQSGPLLQPPAQIPEISTQMQLLIFWGIVFLAFLSLFLVRRRRLGKDREQTDESESLLSEGDALRLLRKFVQNGLEGVSGLSGRLQAHQQRLAAARVRRIYTQLLELCAQLNQPREPAQTPLEFLPHMGELFPHNIAGLELITGAYIRVRYGQFPETLAEVNEIDRAWKSIAEEGRHLRRARAGELKTANLDEARRVKM